MSLRRRPCLTCAASELATFPPLLAALDLDPGIGAGIGDIPAGCVLGCADLAEHGDKTNEAANGGKLCQRHNSEQRLQIHDRLSSHALTELIHA